MLLAAVNLVRTKPRLVAARNRPELGAATAVLLRRLISVEALLVAAAVFAAATLSSLAPPAAALAKEGSALAKVGPGPVSSTVHTGRLHAAGAGDAEQSGRLELVRRPDHEGRRTGHAAPM